MDDDPKPSAPSEEPIVIPREPPPDAGTYFTRGDPNAVETKTPLRK